MNTTERFSGRAGVYQASRPGYPAALSEHLASLGMRAPVSPISEQEPAFSPAFCWSWAARSLLWNRTAICGILQSLS